jgi:hypothetical protein
VDAVTLVAAGVVAFLLLGVVEFLLAAGIAKARGRW